METMSTEKTSENKTITTPEKINNDHDPKCTSEISDSISPVISCKDIKTEEPVHCSGQGQLADSSTNSEKFSLAETLLPSEAIKLEPLDSLDEDASLLQVDQLSNTTPPGDEITKHVRVRKYGPRIRNNISPDTSVCEVCQAEFSNRQLLDSHKLCHFNTAHVCYVCDSYFFNADTLVLHVATIHKSLIPVGHEKDGFFCYICLLRFVSSKSLAHHQQSHVTHDLKSFPCRICGIDFMSARTLMAHLGSSRHAEMKVKITSIFLCIDCRSIFGTRDAYAMHMMMRAQSETCKCTNEEQLPRVVCSPQLPMIEESPRQCRNDSTSTSPLNLSSAIHSCRICGTHFASESLLSLHLLMHSRPQSTTSETQNSDPKPDQNTTTQNGRPNSAPITNKESGQGYICALCMHYFDSQDDLAMHLMTSHSEQAKLGSQQQSSSSQCSVSNGLNYPPSDLTLVCHLCQQKFVSKDSLAMHMMHHAHNQDHLRAATTRSVINLMQSDIVQSATKRMKLSPGRESEDSISLGGKVTPSTDGSELMSGPPTMVQPKCSECNMVFLDNYALSVHMRSPHHQQQNKSSPNGFTCVLCKAIFYTQSSYLVHLQISHSQPVASILTSDTGINALSILTTQAAQSTCKSSTSSMSEPLNLAVDHDATNTVTSVNQAVNHNEEAGYNHQNTCYTDDSHSKSNFLNHQANCELMQTSTTPLDGPTQIDGMDIVDFVKSNANKLMACKYCKIIYTDRTVYHLHMGLHNVNNPWQCNMCGKVCQDVYEFSSHVIHMGY